MAERDDMNRRRSTSDLTAPVEPEYVETAEYRVRATSDLAASQQDGGTAMPEHHGRLFDDEQTDSLQASWEDVQATFVDNPQQAVRQADELVADTLQQIARAFDQERKQLEQQWERGEDVSTEDLRILLQRYRSFFNRLLSV